ncbi:DUF1801 domain-containing protein [Flagellimonas flava]|uniref:YdhG-like domain-containing protein n=1 Tax=Flagellimonas flava TaxID=570519 RepID=A0A1M5IU35_9FLAO|nr:DUF1801 domain-containing protein [Allomuricauda flava]SHG31852.1 protein of unknown function (DU1801) [Allomuricauda flava]
MASVKVTTHPDFEARMDSYPEGIQEKMQELRALVLETAKESSEIERLGEALKWGEPSFLTPQGSTLRMDWKEKRPDQYALYFQCTSKLVHTFRLVFGNDLTYEGNRALIFRMDAPLPKEQIKSCVKATLTYHNVKHLPTLGL